MTSQEKKIRFSSDVTSSPEAKTQRRGSPGALARSAVKSPASVHEGFPPGGSRRLSDATDLHVSVNPNPEIILPLGTPLVTTGKDPVQRVVAGEVANMLADIGSEGYPALRPLMLNLAGTVLEQKVKDPEQFIVDHLFGKKLGQSGSEIDRASLRADQTEEDDDEDAEAAGADEDGAPQRSPRGGTHRKGTSLTFSPVGATVADRLTFGISGPSKAVMMHLVQMVLSTKPEDPEEVMWTHLEANVGHTEACAPEAPDDPTLAALLHELPADSPGYSVALKAILLLFAKRPSNPVNYLFDHYSSRSRSNGAASLCSGSRHAHASGVDAESCTSGEFYEEDRESNDGALTYEQQRRVDGFLGSLPPKGDGESPHRRRGRRATRDSATRVSVRAAANPNAAGPSTAPFSYYAVRGTSPLQEGVPGSTWRPLMPSAYVPSTLSPLEAEEQQRVRHEFELLRAREELRRERLLLELQSLRHEQEYRERVARLDGGPQTQMAARAATEALLEAERYLLLVDQQIARLPMELHRQLRVIASASPTLAWGAAVADAALPAGALATEPRSSTVPPSSAYASRRSEVQELYSEMEVLRRRLDAITAGGGGVGAAVESTPSGHAGYTYSLGSSMNRRDRYSRGV